MFRKIRERKLHFTILAFLIGLFLGINLSFSVSADEQPHKFLDYFHKVYQLLRTEYVDDFNSKTLFYGAINGMIKALNDPFSRFLDEKAYSNLREETSGEFVGIGVQISKKDGNIIVISAFDDTPAMKAGLRSGDIIYKVNNTVIKDMHIDDIIRMIRGDGKSDSSIRIHIIRAGIPEPIELVLNRAPIKVEVVEYAIIDNTDIGYIKMKLFNQDSLRGMEKAIAYFKSKKLGRLVIDLRGNPGGLLQKAIQVANLFLDKGQLIVSIKGREGSGNFKEHRATEPVQFTGKIAVLVDRGSASASEIFSGAIRDNKRGVLVGEKTFGKGSVQKVYDLDINENIGVSLTIAKYYTPSGASIHGTGIMPDYTVDQDLVPQKQEQAVHAILKDKLIEKFVTKNKDYTDENKKKLQDYLRENRYTIPDRTAHFLLKREVERYSKRPVYDREFDNQLNRAIEIVGKQ